MIPTEREIHGELRVSRDGGSSWVDISGYLMNDRIDLGDTSGIGVNPSGVDGVVRQLNFQIHNDLTNDFNPLIKDSSWNQVSGVWSPLLWSGRMVMLRTRTMDTKIEVKNEVIGTGDGTATEFYTDHAPLVNGVVDIQLFTGTTNWWSTTADNWSTITTNWSELGVTAYQTDISYTVDDATGKITFASPVPLNYKIRVTSYSYWQNDSGLIPVFHGYLGEDIDCDKFTVTCQCSDLAYQLQKSMIETETQYGSALGVAAETAIQNMIDDWVSGGPTLYCPVSPGFALLNTEAGKFSNMSVWDGIQKIVGMFGWFCGFLYDSNTGAFRLTLLEPPRTKTTAYAVFNLNYMYDIIEDSMRVKISTRDMRNKWIGYYYNQSTGLRSSVTVSDPLSIAEFGETRTAILEEDNTSLIDTEVEMRNLLTEALNDTKFANGLVTFQMPYMQTMDVFSGVTIWHPKISSGTDFYGIQSISHTHSWPNGPFRTDCSGIGLITGGSLSWCKKQARPGTASDPELKTPIQAFTGTNGLVDKTGAPIVSNGSFVGKVVYSGTYDNTNAIDSFTVNNIIIPTGKKWVGISICSNTVQFPNSNTSKTLKAITGQVAAFRVLFTVGVDVSNSVLAAGTYSSIDIGIYHSTQITYHYDDATNETKSNNLSCYYEIYEIEA